MIYAYKCQNIAINGQGKVNGDGRSAAFAWYPIPKQTENIWHNPKLLAMQCMYLSDIMVDACREQVLMITGTPIGAIEHLYLNDITTLAAGGYTGEKMLNALPVLPESGK
jgi:hypothetical protein